MTIKITHCRREGTLHLEQSAAERGAGVEL